MTPNSLHSPKMQGDGSYEFSMWVVTKGFGTSLDARYAASSIAPKSLARLHSFVRLRAGTHRNEASSGRIERNSGTPFPKVVKIARVEKRRGCEKG